MKKKFFDIIMFWISIVYLIGAIILIITQKIKWDIVNLFNTDGLALLGCLFAMGQLVLSKRNAVSKYINQKLISNKIVQYRIGMVLELAEERTIESWINTFENELIEGLQIDELPRKTITEIINDSCKMYYEICGCMVEFYKTDKTINIRINGKGKYGKLHSRKNDILYLSLLIEIINNKLLQEDFIRKSGTIRIMELAVLKKGSQLSYDNIFNDEVGKIENYDVTVNDIGEKDIQFILTNDEIIMKMVKVKSVINGFNDFTNLLCTIE